MRNFSKSVNKKIEPFLVERGFIYSDGKFIRENHSGVRSMITFDNRGVEKNSFIIMIFVNSVELDDDQGAHCLKYFTGGSLSDVPRNLPCNSSDVLDGRLQRFIENYDEIIENYLSSFKECADIADSLSYDRRLAGYRGDLYLTSHNKEKAKQTYQEWLEYLPSMKHLDNEIILNLVSETQRKIERCV